MTTQELQLRGFFKWELFDKNGNLKDSGSIKNGIVTQGKNSLLDSQFRAQTQITAWYTGLIDNSGWTAESASDTLSSHSGWSEFTSYTGNRIQWSPGAASSGSITNSSTMDFAITGTGTIKGIFICSASSGTSGTLWSTADFPSTIAVANGDTLKVTYTLNA